MALDPVDDIDGLISVTDVSKVETVAELKAVVRAFSDANAVRALDLSGRTRILIGDWLYRRDTQDTQVDDGILVVHDFRGNHWLRIAPPAAAWTGRGAYSGATVYAPNDLVENQNSSWVYINAAPGSGHAPPTLPTKINAWWQWIAGKGDTGSATSSTDVAWSSDTTPAQITADKEDYNPTGLSTAAVIRHDLDAERSINGHAGGADGRLMIDVNTSSKVLRLPAERASSSAANRLAGGDVELDPGAAGLRIYDATSQRWRPVGYRRRPLHLHCKPDPFPTIPHKATLHADWSTMPWIDPGFVFARASVGSYQDRKGILRYAPVGVPRFHTIYSSGETGLLKEASRTNLCVWSQEIDNASWTKNNSTVAADSSVAPDGTNTADRVVEDSNNGSHSVNAASASVVKNVTYTASIWVKEGSGVDYVRLAISAFSGNLVLCDFRLSTLGTVAGASGSAIVTAASIIPYPNGWHRLVVTGIPNAADSSNGVQLQINLRRGNSTTYAGDGASYVYVWGAQLEVGNFQSSYITTASAQVTRSADTLTRSNVPDDFINPAEGTLFASVVPMGVLATGGVSSLIRLDDGTNTNRIEIREGTVISGADFVSVVSNVTELDSASVTYLANTPVKLAGAYKAADFAFTRDGQSPITSAAGAVPASLSRLLVGDGSFALFKSVDYWPRRLSNAQLQAITI